MKMLTMIWGPSPTIFYEGKATNMHWNKQKNLPLKCNLGHFEASQWGQSVPFICVYFWLQEIPARGHCNVNCFEKHFSLHFSKPVASVLHWGLLLLWSRAVGLSHLRRFISVHFSLAILYLVHEWCQSRRGWRGWHGQEARRWGHWTQRGHWPQAIASIAVLEEGWLFKFKLILYHIEDQGPEEVLRLLALVDQSVYVHGEAGVLRVGIKNILYRWFLEVFSLAAKKPWKYLERANLPT